LFCPKSKKALTRYQVRASLFLLASVDVAVHPSVQFVNVIKPAKRTTGALEAALTSVRLEIGDMRSTFVTDYRGAGPAGSNKSGKN
jgi:hypothetical protein